MLEHIKEVTAADLHDAERVDLFVDVGGSIIHIDESKKAKSPIHGALRVSKKIAAGFYQLTADAETRLKVSGKFFLKLKDMAMMLPRIDSRTFIGTTDKPKTITDEGLDNALRNLPGHTLLVYAMMPVDGLGNQDLRIFKKSVRTPTDPVVDQSSPPSDQ